MDISTCKKLLEEGTSIIVCGSWIFNNNFMYCNHTQWEEEEEEEPCCDASYHTIDQVLEDIVFYSDEDWEEVEIYG